MKMKIGMFTSLILLALITSTPAVFAQKPPVPAARVVKFRYDNPKNPKLVPFQKLVQSNQVLEEFANVLNGGFRLPSDLTVTAMQCDTVNAFYSPRDRAIQLCYEFVEYFYSLHTNDLRGPDGKVDAAALQQAVIGSVRFVMYHEVGHALVGILDLPITGREEDAVDQLAAVILLSSEDEADSIAVLDGAYTHLLSADARAASEAKLTPGQRKWLEENPITADEHSLDEQRFYNTICLAYGKDQETFADFVTEGVLPKARAQRCPWEWSRISRSWQRLLEPFAK